MEIYLPYRAIYSPAYHFATFLITTPSSFLPSATCFSLDLFLLPLSTDLFPSHPGPAGEPIPEVPKAMLALVSTAVRVFYFIF